MALDQQKSDQVEDEKRSDVFLYNSQTQHTAVRENLSTEQFVKTKKVRIELVQDREEENVIVDSRKLSIYDDLNSYTEINTETIKNNFPQNIQSQSLQSKKNSKATGTKRTFENLSKSQNSKLDENANINSNVFIVNSSKRNKSIGKKQPELEYCRAVREALNSDIKQHEIQQNNRLDEQTSLLVHQQEANMRELETIEKYDVLQASPEGNAKRSSKTMPKLKSKTKRNRLFSMKKLRRRLSTGDISQYKNENEKERFFMTIDSKATSECDYDPEEGDSIRERSYSLDNMKRRISPLFLRKKKKSLSEISEAELVFSTYKGSPEPLSTLRKKRKEEFETVDGNLTLKRARETRMKTQNSECDFRREVKEKIKLNAEDLEKLRKLLLSFTEIDQDELCNNGRLSPIPTKGGLTITPPARPDFNISRESTLEWQKDIVKRRESLIHEEKIRRSRIISEVLSERLKEIENDTNGANVTSSNNIKQLVQEIVSANEIYMVQAEQIQDNLSMLEQKSEDAEVRKYDITTDDFEHDEIKKNIFLLKQARLKEKANSDVNDKSLAGSNTSEKGESKMLSNDSRPDSLMLEMNEFNETRLFLAAERSPSKSPLLQFDEEHHLIQEFCARLKDYQSEITRNVYQKEVNENIKRFNKDCFNGTDNVCNGNIIVTQVQVINSRNDDKTDSQSNERKINKIADQSSSSKTSQTSSKETQENDLIDNATSSNNNSSNNYIPKGTANTKILTDTHPVTTEFTELNNPITVIEKPTKEGCEGGNNTVETLQNIPITQSSHEHYKDNNRVQKKLVDEEMLVEVLTEKTFHEPEYFLLEKENEEYESRLVDNQKQKENVVDSNNNMVESITNRDTSENSHGVKKLDVIEADTTSYNISNKFAEDKSIYFKEEYMADNLNVEDEPIAITIETSIESPNMNENIDVIEKKLREQERDQNFRDCQQNNDIEVDEEIFVEVVTQKNFHENEIFWIEDSNENENKVNVSNKIIDEMEEKNYLLKNVENQTNADAKDFVDIIRSDNEHTVSCSSELLDDSSTILKSETQASNSFDEMKGSQHFIRPRKENGETDKTFENTTMQQLTDMSVKCDDQNNHETVVDEEVKNKESLNLSNNKDDEKQTVSTIDLQMVNLLDSNNNGGEIEKGMDKIDSFDINERNEVYDIENDTFTVDTSSNYSIDKDHLLSNMATDNSKSCHIVDDTKQAPASKELLRKNIKETTVDDAPVFKEPSRNLGIELNHTDSETIRRDKSKLESTNVNILSKRKNANMVNKTTEKVAHPLDTLIQVEIPTPKEQHVIGKTKENTKKRSEKDKKENKKKKFFDGKTFNILTKRKSSKNSNQEAPKESKESISTKTEENLAASPPAAAAVAGQINVLGKRKIKQKETKEPNKIINKEVSQDLLNKHEESSSSKQAVSENVIDNTLQAVSENVIDNKLQAVAENVIDNKLQAVSENVIDNTLQSVAEDLIDNKLRLNDILEEKVDKEEKINDQDKQPIKIFDTSEIKVLDGNDQKHESKKSVLLSPLAIKDGECSFSKFPEDNEPSKCVNSIHENTIENIAATNTAENYLDEEMVANTENISSNNAEGTVKTEITDVMEQHYDIVDYQKKLPKLPTEDSVHSCNAHNSIDNKTKQICMSKLIEEYDLSNAHGTVQRFHDIIASKLSVDILYNTFEDLIKMLPQNSRDKNAETFKRTFVENVETGFYSKDTNPDISLNLEGSRNNMVSENIMNSENPENNKVAQFTHNDQFTYNNQITHNNQITYNEKGETFSAEQMLKNDVLNSGFRDIILPDENISNVHKKNVNAIKEATEKETSVISQAEVILNNESMHDAKNEVNDENENNYINETTVKRQEENLLQDGFNLNIENVSRLPNDSTDTKIRFLKRPDVPKEIQPKELKKRVSFSEEVRYHQVERKTPSHRQDSQDYESACYDINQSTIDSDIAERNRQLRTLLEKTRSALETESKKVEEIQVQSNNKTLGPLNIEYMKKIEFALPKKSLKLESENSELLSDEKEYVFQDSLENESNCIGDIIENKTSGNFYKEISEKPCDTNVTIAPIHGKVLLGFMVGIEEKENVSFATSSSENNQEPSTESMAEMIKDDDWSGNLTERNLRRNDDDENIESMAIQSEEMNAQDKSLKLLVEDNDINSLDESVNESAVDIRETTEITVQVSAKRCTSEVFVNITKNHMSSNKQFDASSENNSLANKEQSFLIVPISSPLQVQEIQRYVSLSYSTCFAQERLTLIDCHINNNSNGTVAQIGNHEHFAVGRSCEENCENRDNLIRSLLTKMAKYKSFESALDKESEPENHQNSINPKRRSFHGPLSGADRSLYINREAMKISNLAFLMMRQYRSLDEARFPSSQSHLYSKRVHNMRRTESAHTFQIPKLQPVKRK